MCNRRREKCKALGTKISPHLFECTTTRLNSELNCLGNSTAKARTLVDPTNMRAVSLSTGEDTVKDTGGKWTLGNIYKML